MRRLWAVLSDAEPACSLRVWSDEPPAAAGERFTRMLRTEAPLPKWRIEDRSRGPVLHLIARDRSWWWPGETIVLRGEITPLGAGSAMQVACFAMKGDRVFDSRRFAVEVVAALPFVAIGAAILQRAEDARMLSFLLPAVFARDALRKHKTERAARALREWVVGALAPEPAKGSAEFLRF
jgi:hypothetical protein